MRRKEFTGLEVVFMGTAAGGPALHRNAFGIALRLAAHGGESRTWLFDCGEGGARRPRFVWNSSTSVGTTRPR